MRLNTTPEQSTKAICTLIRNSRRNNQLIYTATQIKKRSILYIDEYYRKKNAISQEIHIPNCHP
jgi:hypothetical protein